MPNIILNTAYLFGVKISSIGLGSVLYGLASCEKEKQELKQNQKQEVFWTAEDVKITNAIHYFQNKVKNNTYKNNENLSIDSALWYMEAMLNYNYSTPDSSFVNLTIDTTFVYDLPVNGNEVSYTDVATAAFAMEQHLIDFPFGADDYWTYGGGFYNNGGYCDGPNQNQSLDSDAAEEIQYKINHPNSTNILPPGAYYTNLVSVSDGIYASAVNGGADYYYEIIDYPNLDDDVTYDDWLDYLTLKTQNSYFCLTPEEMNFYLQGNLDIIEFERQKLINLTSINYHFLYTDLYGAWAYGPTFICGRHTYGDLHFRIPED
ncbi:MAG: hypothetical protein B7C24_18275 [Bacteroidetes bacterium 4572_77]|nr:MAG: hypothetical protein B7C24_18275 [Bacteroidetes bacterium 4572_77]